MPWRAVVLYLVGAAFIYANMETAEAYEVGYSRVCWNAFNWVGPGVDTGDYFCYDYAGTGANEAASATAPSYEGDYSGQTGESLAVCLSTGSGNGSGKRYNIAQGDNESCPGSWKTSDMNLYCWNNTRVTSESGVGWVCPDCPAGKVWDDTTNTCEDEVVCPSGQHAEGGQCVCDNEDQTVVSGQCVADCGPYQQWNSTLERCDFECESQAGKTLSCVYEAGETPPDSVCDVGCFANQGGISVVLASGKRSQSFVFTGAYCGGGASDPLLAACTGDVTNDSLDPETIEGRLGPDDQIQVDEGGTEVAVDQDGGSGTIDEKEFGAPDGNECTYSDDGVTACDDAVGGSDPDATVENDNNGDGEPNDGYTVHTQFEGAPPGATIVDPDTGEALGVAVDQDGDGISDGIDTDGDGDLDVDSPDDPGGGCDNNGDGVCDGSDLDNDGDGDKGDAGDCLDDPDTPENECGGTDGPGGAKVAGLPCEETVQCQPDKNDVQGQLWCAQLQLQHEVSCQYTLPEGTDTGQSLFTPSPVDDGSEFLDEVDLSEDAPGLSESVVSAGGGCFQDLTFDFQGQTFAIPLSSLCGAFSAAGAIILVVAYMVAGMVIYRSVF